MNGMARAGRGGNHVQGGGAGASPVWMREAQKMLIVVVAVHSVEQTVLDAKFAVQGHEPWGPDSWWYTRQRSADDDGRDRTSGD